MRLSVIVAVYNVEKYIRRCLDSIINQTYKELEIIIVDDGSTDQSGEICDEYALIDSRIQVIHKENGGLISSRKIGLLNATCEYVINIDSDDWIEEDAFEHIIEKLDEYTPDMLVFGYKKEFLEFVEEYRVGLKKGIHQGEELWKEFNNCFEKYPFFCQPIDMLQWNKIIKRDILNKYQIMCPDKLTKNTDDVVTIPCLLNIDSIFVEERCFYHYCVRKNSVLWKSTEKDYEQLLLLADYLINSYKKGKNCGYLSKKFLLHKLFYHLILDVPEIFLSEKQCAFFPQLKKEYNIIVYGKGVFADRFINSINTIGFCHVIDNIDIADSKKLQKIDERQYEYIVIAVLNAFVVDTIKEHLIRLEIDQNKIVCIEKENLTPEILPDKIKKLWEDFSLN